MGYVMPIYRFYTIGENGHISGLPKDYELPDDAAALRRAKLIIDQHTIEVWQGTRTVARVQPDEE